MASIQPTVLESLVTQISAMPLWIKQVLYAQLAVDMEKAVSRATMEAFTPEHMLQLWVPEATHEGIHALSNPEAGLSGPLKNLVYLTRYKKSVANITVMNKWSLEQCSLYLREAMVKQLVDRPQSGIIMATIDFLSGYCRLGEYLVKINRVSVDQLEQALRTQKYIEDSMGERTGLANVMINLGYINKEDTEGILFLKEESKKPFQYVASAIPTPVAPGQPQAPGMPGIGGAPGTGGIPGPNTMQSKWPGFPQGR